jgi:hypothetical protein
VDYKALNKVIANDCYGMTNINQLYQALSKSTVKSKIDFKMAFHQIPVHPNSIEITGFVCEFGTYEWLGMPMGIRTAPAWFQRFMNNIFEKFIHDNCLRIYLDDNILYSNSIEEHVQQAKDVIQCIRDHNLKVSLEKCEIAQTEIKVLGNIIGHQIIKPSPNRATCIAKRPKPRTLKELQGWLGAANYLREFIQHYAAITHELYAIQDLKNIPKNLRKKNGQPDGRKVIIKWTEAAEKSYETLRDVLCSELVLTLPDFDLQFYVTTDACDYGWGAVLEQDFSAKYNSTKPCFRPIEYESKKYTTAQSNYATNEKELLAIYLAIKKWHPMLFGKRFTVYTDHLPLTAILTAPRAKTRLQRWYVELMIYDFEITSNYFFYSSSQFFLAFFSRNISFVFPIISCPNFKKIIA